MTNKQLFVIVTCFLLIYYPTKGVPVINHLQADFPLSTTGDIIYLANQGYICIVFN